MAACDGISDTGTAGVRFGLEGLCTWHLDAESARQASVRQPRSSTTRSALSLLLCEDAAGIPCDPLAAPKLKAPFFTNMSSRSSSWGLPLHSFSWTAEALEELQRLHSQGSRLQPPLVALSGDGSPSDASGTETSDKLDMLVPASVEAMSKAVPTRDTTSELASETWSLELLRERSRLDLVLLRGVERDA